MIEVKKPNNKDGLKAEYERMNERLRNEKFRRFLNEFQLFIFSNNQEYEDDDPEHLVGAYYATNGEKSLRYNHFREELPSEVINDIAEIDADTEQRILDDNRCPEIYHNAEYSTNKRIDTPTNRLLTGLFHRDRLRFLLKHGIVYVKEQDEKTGEIHLQKHIMRYPQLFAAKQTLKTLDAGKKNGVIWHTQGSGKTAFAFYSVSILTEYFAQKQIVPKFYFLVDRLDLANQAASEFEKRGLKTYRINSRDELVQHFRETQATHSGQREICVLNIQKFVNDATAINETGYNIDIQRIFFIDEAHRSYKPQGSFLPNLFNADKNAIRIALTGTPLIVPNGNKGWLNRFATKEIFGDYIHKYYYDRSILDGYTLKLMREKIQTSYVEGIQKAIEDIKIHKGDISLQEIHEHEKYYEPLLDYIVADFNRSRLQFANDTIGAMVICYSNRQAERLFQLFQQKYATQNSAILILHDYGNEDSRKQDIQQFKDGKIDFVFVDEMLITGFDCPRLKKLYLERKIKAHNLLQALTRVNRPYQNFRFGFVVDFANIEEEFNKTNQAYSLELKQSYQGYLDEDEQQIFNSLFISEEEIAAHIAEIKSALFEFDLDDLENFRLQIDNESKEKLYQLRKLLQLTRQLANFLRLQERDKLLSSLDFEQIKQILTIIDDRIHLLNAKEASEENSGEYLSLLLENIYFKFDLNGKEELKIVADEGRRQVGNARRELLGNFDQKDPQWVLLHEEFKRLMDKQEILQKSTEYSVDKQEELNRQFERIYEQAKKLNLDNNKLKSKYKGDEKFVRIDKRIAESNVASISQNREQRWAFLLGIKNATDGLIFNNHNLLENESYFLSQIKGITIDEMMNNKEHKIDLTPQTALFVSEKIRDEYFQAA